MATKKNFRLKGLYFLSPFTALLFLSFAFVSCNDTDTGSPTGCEPWVRWKITFNDNVTQDQINVDKAATELVITEYINVWNANPNVECSKTMEWTNSGYEYDFKVCLNCRIEGSSSDIRARPPACGPKPPPSIFEHATVVNTTCPQP